MKLELSRAHFPVTVLGYGRRAGLWFQGCSVGCKGCIALDTWPANPTMAVSVTDVLGWCRSLPPAEVQGVTISGGEPFDQPQALVELLQGLREWRSGLPHDVDLLCYSGRSKRHLETFHRPILDLLDAVISGPFVASQAPGKIWRGSANQQLEPLSVLGHSRYDVYIDQDSEAPRLQATIDGGTIWYIGVPRPGDFTAVEAALAKRGILHESASWRS